MVHTRDGAADEASSAHLLLCGPVSNVDWWLGTSALRNFSGGPVVKALWVCVCVCDQLLLSL